MQTDDNRIVGNYGTNLVGALLSRYCMVRQVPKETDMGIDLLCETLIKKSAQGETAENPGQTSKGFLHFFVQVKAGKQVKQPGQDIAKIEVDKTHVQYWPRQPVPVFLFMVPCKKPDPDAKKIFIAEINLRYSEAFDENTCDL